MHIVRVLVGWYNGNKVKESVGQIEWLLGSIFLPLLHPYEVLEKHFPIFAFLEIIYLNGGRRRKVVSFENASPNVRKGIHAFGQSMTDFFGKDDGTFVVQKRRHMGQSVVAEDVVQGHCFG